MSLPPAEERKFERTKVNQLAHIEWLLERLIWTLAPGNLDFPVFQNIVLWREYHALQVGSTEALPVRETPGSSSEICSEDTRREKPAGKGREETYEDFTLSQVP